MRCCGLGVLSAGLWLGRSSGRELRAVAHHVAEPIAGHSWETPWRFRDFCDRQVLRPHNIAPSATLGAENPLPDTLVWRHRQGTNALSAGTGLLLQDFG